MLYGAKHVHKGTRGSAGVFKTHLPNNGKGVHPNMPENDSHHRSDTRGECGKAGDLLGTEGSQNKRCVGSLKTQGIVVIVTWGWMKVPLNEYDKCPKASLAGKEALHRSLEK